MCCSSSNQFGIVVLQQFLIEAHVLFLGQDGIVGLEVVLLQKRLVAIVSLVFNPTTSENGVPDTLDVYDG